ncbi:UDP-glucosyltransferase 2 [Drosophila ficusphila]|uniref:UDP-glucosyltransferase 2 n=1 Tax=Drosophila ficusphila TaxID=30025 RepID=UPI0007E75C73|nr:UDP-glucosyltransferase 2 [Drosophila ficusphila]
MLALRSLFLVLALSPGFLEGARILALFPIPSPSHYFYSLPYLKSLATLGHEITLVSPFPAKEAVDNIHNIYVPELFDNVEEVINYLSTSKSKGIWEVNEYVNNYNLNLAKTVLNNDAVRREILKPGKAQFDLIITDLWRFDALYGLSAYFDAPIIGIATYGNDWKIDELVGNISPISYLKSTSYYHHDLRTYRGRLAYFVDQSLSWINWHWRYAEKHEALYRKYFPKIADKQPLSAICRNFSLVLINHHFTLGAPRPFVPSLIEVGGMHINEQPKALPKEFEDFIQGAGEHGVIYFSLGTNVKTENLSEDRKKILIETFESLPQRVLWKFEDENLPGRPSNVLISKWFPQQDLLAHPKVKLFITHSGLQSTVESIHSGTPMLGLPFFYDQYRNVAQVKELGLGLSLNFMDMTGDEFKSTIIELLTEKKYDIAARTAAARHRDQPMKPLETAIWWTHYVLRHKGAPHMRVAGRELDFFTHHSLDILGTFLIGFLLILAIVAMCVKKILKSVFRSRKHKTLQKKKVR